MNRGIIANTMSKIPTIFLIILVQCTYALCDNGTSRSVPVLPQPRYDGDGNPQWFPRIIGGFPVKLGDFKSIISIQVRKTGQHFCGGTLINSSFVLTAAHCLTDSETGQMALASRIQLMGDDISIARNSSQTSPRRQVRHATQLFVHPEYSIETLQNDIAVIRVKPPFIETATLTSAELPNRPPPTNGSCLVAGWGVTKENGTVSPHLLAVSVNIVATKTCNSRSIYDGLIQPGMFCAGHMAGGHDSCQGDSGGGLICGNSSSPVTGVVSFGKGCGRRNFPGVYTNVHEYVPWIMKVLQWSEHQAPPTPTTVKPHKKPSSGTICGVAVHLVMFCALLTSVFAI